MGSGYKRTGIPGIYSTPNGKYVVNLYHKKGKNLYLGRYDTLYDAKAACSAARESIQEERTAHEYELIPSMAHQCIRCSRPHLPGSKYCEHHTKRAEKNLRTTAK